ncbi:ATP-binding protein [Rhodococcus jostii]|uniref:ATP-binding protein n=1 Tax=Rhodococcus jostii TaxID=132919 RepID=UPI0036338004
MGDVARLSQLVMNLLTNAIRYAPLHTPIDVAMGTNGGQAVIEVIDHGPGISGPGQHASSNVSTDPDASRTRIAGSSVLGLSIAAAIVAAHARQIELDTNTTGTGSTFRVTLPVFEPGGYHDDE